MAVQRTFYKGKKELTMAEFEAITELDPNIDYDITDYPITSITNDQMAYALTCSKLFTAGTTFVCADEGNYTQGTTYQIVVNGSTKGWVAISKSSEPIAETIRDNTTQIVPISSGLAIGGANKPVYETSIAIGKNADTGSSGVAIGHKAVAANGLVALGRQAVAAGDESIAIGYNTKASATKSIIIDPSVLNQNINSTPNSFQIASDNIYKFDTHTLTVQNAQVNGTNIYGILQGETEPTEATAGNLSQVYFNTVNERYYICTKVETDKYTWKEIAVLEQVTLSGENGTLTDYEYNLLTLYETTKIIRSGVEFKRQAKPLNGSGKYVYTSTYYSEANGGTSEEYATYIILIDPDDKSWKFVLKNNPSTVTNAVLYSAQTLTQEQKDQACANIGINNKNYIEITDVPETATAGTITDAQLATLQASNTSYILFNHEKYDLQDIQTAKGYLIFTHKGEDSTDNMFTKCIAVTISTKAWKLKIQGTDDIPTENSTNLITSGAIYAANELKADANAENIDYASFAAKLNVEQSFTLNEDGSKTIRFGNLLVQTKEMTISANSSATFTFAIPFDADHVLCWCNSAASAQSSNNTAAVTEYSTTSMTVRVTNADSVVTMFAIGWKAN